jgi:hypothetical protein
VACSSARHAEPESRSADGTCELVVDQGVLRDVGPVNSPLGTHGPIGCSCDRDAAP